MVAVAVRQWVDPPLMDFVWFLVLFFICFHVSLS